MSRDRHVFPSQRRNRPDGKALVLPLERLDRAALPLAGGKAANLGELIRAGFPVPAGFCVTTTAYALVAAHAKLDAALLELEAVAPEDSARQIALATVIRTALSETPLPPEVVAAITTAYQALSPDTPIPVAVRSSATAEDLPDASFAGQQETLLNVIGLEQVLPAVQRCFASLWTNRATQYRSSLGIAPRSVCLAVVVQRMVEAEVAGVLFTANPLTGKRSEAVIDANPGLGEAVVSGATNPDHFVVRTTTGEIVERRLGDKQVQMQAAAGGGTQRLVDQLRQPSQIDAGASAAAHLAAAEALLRSCLRVAFRVSPVMLAGMQSYALAQRLLGELAAEQECQIVLGGSPTNPTTQMHLALFRLAQDLRADADSRHLLQNLPAEQLTKEYHQGGLPAPLQQGLARFLLAYGHQSVCELDLGVPRWAEDPTDVLAYLSSYLELEARAQTPDRQLHQADRAARAMIATLSQRVRPGHWLRRWLVRFCLERAHALAGFREMTRFVVGLVLAQARAHLWPVGAALVEAGRLNQAEDIFWLAFPEAHAALAGADLREQVSERRATFERELRRRRVPLVLLSDGTEPAAQAQHTPNPGQPEGVLQGTPASPGRVTTLARVILDPHQARLASGEILVVPSTDPGWTPLFLQAAGLVMEVGGAMAHGAIVAREYGLPAVVGVRGATTHIRTGQRITIDGAAGTILVEP